MAQEKWKLGYLFFAKCKKTAARLSLQVQGFFDKKQASYNERTKYKKTFKWIKFFSSLYILIPNFIGQIYFNVEMAMYCVIYLKIICKHKISPDMNLTGYG